MRICSIYVFFAFVIIGVIGCTSPRKCVLVSVVDSKKGTPVAGATVSVHFYPRTRTVTGKDGLALLKLTPKEADDPIFDVEIANKEYEQNFGYSETKSEWMKRPAGSIPTKPDIVLEVVSRVDQRQGELEKSTAGKMADDAAEKLFRESPDYWPERTNEVASLLFRKRWENASKQALGTPEDVNAIRGVVVRHMKMPQASVNEIRWISPRLVMVKSSWYSGPEASAGYTYVLKKSDAGWTVLTFAVDYVS